MIVLVREYGSTFVLPEVQYESTLKYFRTEVLPYLLAKFMLATFEGTFKVRKYLRS